ncbi:WD domain, G-beta repeat protein [Dictyocaulus viviparus]|uniref:WD domain, G-beta repeat protein n=1 Tax=Dictyocaulus viviparus TaxID=29172 RepID=A0A0D8XPK7_DICVI|nr:WD domain, G-beta repeat protein [Dictyocaulus viviparus]
MVVSNGTATQMVVTSFSRYGKRHRKHLIPSFLAGYSGEYTICQSRIQFPQFPLFDKKRIRAVSASSPHILNKDEEIATTLDDVEGMLERNAQKRRCSPTSFRNASISPSCTDTCELLPYKARRHTATTEELLYPSDTVETTKVNESTKTEVIDEAKKEKRQKADGKPFLLPTLQSAPTALRRHSKFRNTIADLSDSHLRGVASRLPTPPIGRGCDPLSFRMEYESHSVNVSSGNSIVEWREILTLAAGRKDCTEISNLVAQNYKCLRYNIVVAYSKLSNQMHFSSRLPSLMEAATTFGGHAKFRGRAGTDSTRGKSDFTRLIPSTSDANPSTKQGRIIPVKLGNGSQYRVVTRNATIEGHSKAVLSVATTDSFLLSGSKDRTAKLWDLQTASEVRTLGVHPNNVHAVRFVPNSHLAISVSMYQVRVWDIRTQECIRMLQSSGQVNDELHLHL